MPFPFPLHHLPALFIITTTTLGSAAALLNTPWCMREFGLPERLVRSREAQSVFLLNNGRTFTIGVLLAVFYLRGEYEVVDTILAAVGGILGVTDAVVVWKEGMKRMAVFRLGMSWTLAGWGWCGGTEGW
ncbi:hypothetical protein BU23DRAFT_522398 [Bimuria novae-zelandiae CBS 107.79]|uniref:Uncharacterized protein n=1 Tax=Bimuria novae-zelandiae CBS 107.79 TaxID=1447943 RepID=A0A6A5W4D2_9PLEO|nr:hypothetical protein BU23DRAFT_522398 [Bimuria novae-zelandiae CBS 107.79]